MKYLVTTFLLFSFTTFAQITITSADINAQYTVGNSFTIKTDTIVNQVDIGQLGSTSWDFSFLTPNPAYDFVTTVVDPNSTPYIGNFPGSNIATKSQIDIMGSTFDIYSYLSVNGSFNFHGSVGEVDTILVTTTSNPIEPLGISPFTFGSIIDYNGERTTVMEITGLPSFTTITTVISSSVVDAYGPMTLPGGRVVDALRIKEDEINIIQDPFPFYSRTISYTFLAKDGSQVNVPSDTTKPETGFISNTASVSWNDALVTSVRLEETIPNNYSLRQNYPNPFNPSTNIEYTIPSESFVELKVYDVLGNEVATLVNEQQQAGIYRAEFTADNLSSGMYFARITANSFTRVVKMILLK